MINRGFATTRKAATTMAAATVERLSRTTITNLMRDAATLGALVVAGAVALSGAQTAQATDNPFEQVCEDAWDDAPARPYCSAIVNRIGTANDTTGNQCYLLQINCRATVNVATDTGTQLETFEAWQYSLTQSPQATDDITLCWASDQGSYAMLVSATACGSDQISLSTAGSTGLPALPASTGASAEPSPNASRSDGS